MRLGDELAIIAAGTQPRVACGPTDHQRTLRAALDSITPADGPTRVAEAVALARRLLSGSEKLRKVVVISDGGFDGAAELARQDDVELIAVGKKTGNVGITRLQARRSLLDPIGYEILVEVANAIGRAASSAGSSSTSTTSRSTSCRLNLAARRTDGAGLREDVGRRRPAPRLDRSSRRPAGRQHGLGDPAPPRSPEGHAGHAGQPVPREGVRGDSAGGSRGRSRSPRMDGPRAAQQARPADAPVPITVYHRKVPDVLPAGHVLVIEPERSGPLWQLGEALHNPVVAKQDKDSPLMLHIRLDNVVMPEARKLTLKAPAQVLAESAAGDPLYAVLDRRAARRGQARRADGRPRQERPAAPDGLPDHDDQPARAGSAGPRASCARRSPPARSPRSSLPGENGTELDRVLVSPDGRESADHRRPAGTTKVDASARSTAAASGACWRGRPARPGSRSAAEKSSRQARRRARAGLQPRRSPRERPAPAGRTRSSRPTQPGRRSGDPADLVLSAGLGLDADVLGVVPLPAEVDRLMGTAAAGPARADAPLVALGTGRAAGPGLLTSIAPWSISRAGSGVLSLWLRGAIVVLLLLALAGLNLVRPTRELFVVFALDRSESIGEPGNAAADAFLAKAAAAGGLAITSPCCRSPPQPGNVRSGAELITALKTPASSEPQKRRADRGQRRRPSPRTPRGSTARGPTWRRRSRWPRPRSRRFTSPGSSCSPTATPRPATPLKAAAALAGQGRGAHGRRCPAATDPEVQLSAVTRPAQVLQGEPFNVEVLIDSNHDDEAGPRRGLSRRHQGRRPAGQAQERRKQRRPQADDRPGRADADHGAAQGLPATRCWTTTATSAWSRRPASRGCSWSRATPTRPST